MISIFHLLGCQRLPCDNHLSVIQRTSWSFPLLVLKRQILLSRRNNRCGTLTIDLPCWKTETKQQHSLKRYNLYFFHYLFTFSARTPARSFDWQVQRLAACSWTSCAVDWWCRAKAMWDRRRRTATTRRWCPSSVSPASTRQKWHSVVPPPSPDDDDCWRSIGFAHCRPAVDSPPWPGEELGCLASKYPTCCLLKV